MSTAPVAIHFGFMAAHAASHNGYFAVAPAWFENALSPPAFTAVTT